MDLFISLSRGDIFATKEVHFDLSGLPCHLRNRFINTRDQQNHLETSWYFEKSVSGSEFSMMMKMLEVLMLLMMVINLQECLFRNRKHCCFCVCSNYRVDVRMSAASGGKFCVNIFCFQDPPHHIVWSLHFASLPQETCCFKVQIQQHRPQSWTCVLGTGYNLWYQLLLLVCVCVLLYCSLHYEDKTFICTIYRQMWKLETGDFSF